MRMWECSLWSFFSWQLGTRSQPEVSSDRSYSQVGWCSQEGRDMGATLNLKAGVVRLYLLELYVFRFMHVQLVLALQCKKLSLQWMLALWTCLSFGSVFGVGLFFSVLLRGTSAVGIEPVTFLLLNRQTVAPKLMGVNGRRAKQAWGPCVCGRVCISVLVFAAAAGVKCLQNTNVAGPRCTQNVWWVKTC